MLVDEQPIGAFYVDVNAATETGQVGTTIGSAVEGYEPAPADLGIGSYVWAVDADDNACLALVTDLKQAWLQLHMDESSWQPMTAVLGHPKNRTAPEYRVGLPGVDPLEAVRAMLRTPPPT